MKNISPVVATIGNIHLYTLSFPWVTTATRFGFMYLYSTERSFRTRPCEWTCSFGFFDAICVIFCEPSNPLKLFFHISTACSCWNQKKNDEYSELRDNNYVLYPVVQHNNRSWFPFLYRPSKCMCRAPTKPSIRVLHASDCRCPTIECLAKIRHLVAVRTPDERHNWFRWHRRWPVDPWLDWIDTVKRCQWVRALLESILVPDVGNALTFFGRLFWFVVHCGIRQSVVNTLRNDVCRKYCRCQIAAREMKSVNPLLKAQRNF